MHTILHHLRGHDDAQDIVLKQTALNSSFDQKTSYSKAKYIARKEAKCVLYACLRVAAMS